MKILCWNMNYWQNTKGNILKVIEWKDKCIKFLKQQNDIDFYILQEINPFKLFEKIPNQYEFSLTDYNILYHELTSELLFDGRKSNFWGNAILFHKKNILEKNNLETTELYDMHKYYYGRNCLMCYDFISQEKNIVTIINIYNKIDYAHKGVYTMLENDNDIKNILENKNNIIMTGDLNKGFGINDREKYEEFINSYNNRYNLKNYTRNYYERFIPTYYHNNNNGYVNDFCLLKGFDDIKIINKNDEWQIVGNKMLWKGLSDHRPLIIDLK